MYFFKYLTLYTVRPKLNMAYSFENILAFALNNLPAIVLASLLILFIESYLLNHTVAMLIMLVSQCTLLYYVSYVL
jgi:hypothetical protein